LPLRAIHFSQRIQEVLQLFGVVHSGNDLVFPFLAESEALIEFVCVAAISIKRVAARTVSVGVLAIFLRYFV